MTHSKQWEFLKGKFEAGQLSHAYLFSGQEGIDLPAQAGKKEFAKEFIKLINKSIVGAAVAIEKEQFPDLLMVRSINSKSSIDNEKDMMEIDIAQIREISNFLSLRSYYGNYKAVIIENADRMNIEAQHSFLKTLEEPKGKTLIILLSDKPDLLLNTIFSRCQTIKFFPTSQSRSQSDRGSSHGFNELNPSGQKTSDASKALQELLPILNSELAVKFQYAKKANLEGDHFNIMLRELQRYFRNLLLIKIGVIKEEVVGNYSIEKLRKIIKLIEDLHAQMLTTNASPKLALEVLLLEI